MKKLLFCLLMMSVWISSPVNAEEAKSNGEFLYKIVTVNGQQEVRIESSLKSHQHLVIPNKIEGLPVTEIADNAFSQIQDGWDLDISYKEYAKDYLMKSVSLPNTLKRIGSYAFGNNLLTDIVLPEGLEEIGYGAFTLNDLTTITIPSSVHTIKGEIVSGNPIKTQNLPEQFQIGQTFEDVTYMVFEHNGNKEIRITGVVSTTKNKKIVVPEKIKQLPVTEIGDFAFSPSTSLLGLSHAPTLEEVILPNSIRKIGRYAFALQTIEKKSVPFILPSELTYVGDSAFSYTRIYNGGKPLQLSPKLTYIGQGAFGGNQLKGVVIPGSVKYMGQGAFSGNILKEVTIGEGIIAIEAAVFEHNQLTTVNLPQSLKEIKARAFEYNQLTKLDLPNGLQTIGEYAFYDNKLTALTLPNSVVSIGEAAFKLNGLRKLVLSNKLEEIEGEAFATNKLPSLTLPKSVKKIGELAFYRNDLQQLTMTDSVIEIGTGAFSENELEEVRLSNNLQVISLGAFASNNLKTIVIPSSVTEVPPFVFENNPLTSATIMPNVESVNIAAFIQTELETLQILGTSTYIANAPEDFADSIPKLYTDTNYVTAWDNWFKVITEPTTLYMKSTPLVEEKPSTSKFKDTANHWAKNTIDDLVAKGIISGYPDGTFRPNEPMKRKHVASIMAKVYELELTHEATAFSDVSQKHPNYAAITTLQRAGVIHGSNGQFRPEETLTRGQMAKILVLASGFTPGGQTTFKDITASYWAYDYITALADLKVVGGDNGSYKPNAAVTRGQFVGMLSNALKVMESSTVNF